MSSLSFNWSQYTGNLTWLSANTIFLTRHGSHAYGTSLPTSDLDIRGIAIAPKEYYLGYSKVFEQAEQKDPDMVVFELRKFFKLASVGNPNALELIYTDPSDHLSVSSLGSKLLENRDLFLSKKCRWTFAGYANAQMNRIKTHRRWLLNPINEPPTRKEFGLSDSYQIPKNQLDAAKASVNKVLDRWNWHYLDEVDSGTRRAVLDDFQRMMLELTSWSTVDLKSEQYLTACKSLGFDANFIDYLDRERRYDAKVKEFEQYRTWKKERNPVRAEMEAKTGYDSKHGMHLVRLSLMCEEILLTGKVNVRRPDAEFLLSIRNGAWSYEKLVEWFAEQEQKIAAAYDASKLPNAVNPNKLDSLAIELVETFLKGRV
jgi:predicted nucleotidyltransferase